MNGQLDDQKKRKSEEVPPPTEVIIPVKKQRVAHASTDSAPAKPVALCPPKPPPRLSPGMVMIERFKKFQEAKAAAAAGATAGQVQQQPVAGSSSLSLAAKTTVFAVPVGTTEKKRIAHVPNVAGLLSAKAKTVAANPSVQPAAQQAPQKPPTLAGSAAMRRPLTTPSTRPAPPVTNLPRPTIAVELGCKVPANIRQKYLNVLVDETLKIYDRAEDAYERAVEEEKAAYAKSSSKVVYINVVTNLVQRIRREVSESGGANKTAPNPGNREQ